MENLSLEMSLILISQLLGLFGNTLPADDKYFLLNLENFQQPFQMQVSGKVKAF